MQRLQWSRILIALGLPLILAGCTPTAGNDGGASNHDLSVNQDMPLMAPCSRSCGGCAANQRCVGTSATQGYSATCRNKCRVTSDCAAGERCATLFNEVGVGLVCVSDSVPALCPGTAPDPAFDCLLQKLSCADANTMWRAFVEPRNQTCGYEAIACPNGCEQGNADAGTDAHCK
jgi:hypothetical protein